MNLAQKIQDALIEQTYDTKMERIEQIEEEHNLELFDNDCNSVRSVEKQLQDIEEALQIDEFENIRELLLEEKEFLQKYNTKDKYGDDEYYILTFTDANIATFMCDVVINSCFEYVDKIWIS